MKTVLAMQDESGHWYVIPSDMCDKWHELEELMYSENQTVFQEAENKFIETFSKYMTGGSLNNVQLYAEIILAMNSDLLQTIKDQISRENTCSNWDNFRYECLRFGEPDRLEQVSDEVCKRYAIEVAKASLKKASEKATLIDKSMNIVAKSGHGLEVNKESITSESNIKL